MKIKNTMTLEEYRLLAGVHLPKKPTVLTLREYKAILSGENIFPKLKFGNVKAKCLLGHTHDSKAEAGYCNILKTQKWAGAIKDFEIQVPYPLHVEGKQVCIHYVDFRVYFYNGICELHEVKGGRATQTAIWKLKRKMLLAEYPNSKYVVVEHSKGEYKVNHSRGEFIHVE